MARFSLALCVFLSSLVVAVMFGSSDLAQALTSQERQAIENRIKDAETEIRGLNQSIASSEEWLNKHAWMVAGCPFVKAGVTFVIPSTGVQWKLADYYAAIDKDTRIAQAEKDARKAKALQMSNQEAKLCQDTYYTSYVAAKAKVDTLRKEIAALRAKLAAPPPASTATWSGRYVTPIGTTFNMKIEGNKFICKATIFSEDNIYMSDECEWNGKEPINCTYTQRQGDNFDVTSGGYKWNTEGTSKFVWQDGTIIRTTKANGKIVVTFAKDFGGEIWVRSGGNAKEVERAKQQIIEDVNRKRGAEEFRLRRFGEW